MGDVATLDAAGDDGQSEALLQVPQPLLHVVALAALLGEAVAGVVVAHREEIDPMAAAGDGQRDLVARAIGEPRRDPGDALGLAGQDDLVRDEDRQRFSLGVGRLGERGAVVLREERRDDLLVGDLRLLDRIRGDVLQLARDHVQERHLGEIALAVEAEDVAVDVVDRDDALLLAHLLDRA